MPFIVLPTDANQAQALAQAFTDTITYGLFKEWRDRHMKRNSDYGDLEEMNFTNDDTFTTYNKDVFEKLYANKSKHTHIGVVFGSRKGDFIQGIGNYRDLTSFLTLAIEQSDGKIIPDGDAYRGGNNFPSDPDKVSKFQKRYSNRIKKLRKNQNAAKEFSSKETTGVFHKIEPFFTHFIGSLDEEQMVKVFFVKDGDKTTVVFSKGSFIPDESENKGGDRPKNEDIIGYDHGTGCCPIA